MCSWIQQTSFGLELFVKLMIKISVFSSWKDMILGVPQGSVLWPLLLNIYLNDFFSTKFWITLSQNIYTMNMTKKIMKKLKTRQQDKTGTILKIVRLKNKESMLMMMLYDVIVLITWGSKIYYFMLN